MMQFKEMSMEKILKYVKETEKKLEDMQKELKKFEDKKMNIYRIYTLEKLRYLKNI